MTRRPRLWLIGATLFTLANFGGAIAAAIEREGMHTGVHLGLTLLGAYLAWRLIARSRQEPTAPQDPSDRLEYLQESVDAIALEVERIGEAQRFDAKLRQEGGTRKADVASRDREPRTE